MTNYFTFRINFVYNGKGEKIKRFGDRVFSPDGHTNKCMPVYIIQLLITYVKHFSDIKKLNKKNK